jgi:tetratricopeptide (TPR) repeat protein
MNTRSAMLGGLALLVVATAVAGWMSLGIGHRPAVIADVEDVRLPVPPLPPRVSEGPEYERCLGLLAGDPDGARAMAETWATKGGGDGAAHCLALSRVAEGEPQVGAELLEKLAADSHAAPALRATLYSQAAQAWTMAGEPQRAELGLTQALMLVPDDADLLVDRAGASVALGRYAAAAEDLTNALRDDPRRVDALVLRATALRHMGKMDTARGDINRALDEEPDNPEGLLERGILRQRGGDAAGARADWQRVIDIAPDGATADLAEQNLALLDAGPPR